MSQITSFFKGLTTCLLRGVEKHIPRDRNKWVFGALNKFMDNPKYLFWETNDNHKEIRPIWIAHNHLDVSFLHSQGCEVYYWLSFKGLYHSLTAKVFVCDHHIGNVNQFASGGAFLVNLWHGSSVKKVRWQAPEYYIRKHHLKDKSEMTSSFFFKMKEYSELFIKPDLLLAPSNSQLQMFFSQMLDVPQSKCIVSTFPRSKYLIEGRECAVRFIEKHEPRETLEFVSTLSSYRKTYIYMPTWRMGNADFIHEAGIDWHSLDETLKEKNELFILKFHPFTKLDENQISKYSNLRIYPSDCDIYTILPFVDCLITDYSSIYTDFVMMNKEIILFIFDFEEYIKNSHSLENYNKYYLGRKTYDFSQLLNLIKQDVDCHLPQRDYEFVMKFFWDNNEQKKDIVEEIKKRI